MSQTKPQNIPSSSKPMKDDKTPMPKQTGHQEGKNAGAHEEQRKDKGPHASKNQTSQK